MPAQRGGPIGGAGQREASLGGDGIGLGALIGCFARGQVVVCERAGQLVLAEALEVTRGGQVTRASVAARQRAVRDLADERLDELVLPALGRARIGLEVEQLAPHEPAQPRLQLVDGHAAHRCQRIGREDLAEHGGVLEQGPIGPSSASSREAMSERSESGTVMVDRSPTGS